MAASDLEYEFQALLQQYAPRLLQRLEREYRFAAIYVGLGPGLRHRLREAGLHDWRFDWADPESCVAIENDGGQWSPCGGRHNTDGDRWKMSCAAALGWRVLRFSGEMVRNDPMRCIALIDLAIEKGESKC